MLAAIISILPSYVFCLMSFSLCYLDTIEDYYITIELICHFVLHNSNIGRLIDVAWMLLYLYASQSDTLHAIATLLASYRLRPTALRRL